MPEENQQLNQRYTTGQIVTVIVIAALLLGVVMRLPFIPWFVKTAIPYSVGFYVLYLLVRLVLSMERIAGILENSARNREKDL